MTLADMEAYAREKHVTAVYLILRAHDLYGGDIDDMLREFHHHEVPAQVERLMRDQKS